MAQPTLDIWTNPKGLGRVYREEMQIVVKYSELNIPFTDTTGNTSLNWKGKTRLIILQGAQDGASFDGITQDQKLGDFVYELEQWVNSNVQTSQVYTSSLGDAYDVVCHDFTWVRSNTDPYRILWSLLLKES